MLNHNAAEQEMKMADFIAGLVKEDEEDMLNAMDRRKQALFLMNSHLEKLATNEIKIINEIDEKAFLEDLKSCISFFKSDRPSHLEYGVDDHIYKINIHIKKMEETNKEKKMPFLNGIFEIMSRTHVANQNANPEVYPIRKATNPKFSTFIEKHFEKGLY